MMYILVILSMLQCLSGSFSPIQFLLVPLELRSFYLYLFLLIAKQWLTADLSAWNSIFKVEVHLWHVMVLIGIFGIILWPFAYHITRWRSWLNKCLLLLLQHSCTMHVYYIWSMVSVVFFFHFLSYVYFLVH